MVRTYSPVGSHGTFRILSYSSSPFRLRSFAETAPGVAVGCPGRSVRRFLRASSALTSPHSSTSSSGSSAISAASSTTGPPLADPARHRAPPSPLPAGRPGSVRRKTRISGHRALMMACGSPAEQRLCAAVELLATKARARRPAGEMRPSIRWLVAGLVFLAALFIATWIFEALVLPRVIKDNGVRWGAATALGAAVAAFVALWGNWYATKERIPIATAGEATAPTGTPGWPPPLINVALQPGYSGVDLHIEVLNCGDASEFSAEVIGIRDLQGHAIGPQRWPIPWLGDGSVTPKEILKTVEGSSI
jgi:hypothetical protein